MRLENVTKPTKSVVAARAESTAIARMVFFLLTLFNIEKSKKKLDIYTTRKCLYIDLM